MQPSNSQQTNSLQTSTTTNTEFINESTKYVAYSDKYSLLAYGKKPAFRHSLSTDLESSSNLSGYKPRSASCLENFRNKNKSFDSGKSIPRSDMVTPQENTSTVEMDKVDSNKELSNPETSGGIITQEEVNDQWSSIIYQNGSRLFQNKINGERWWLASDADGHEYYYEESTNKSTWELPNYKNQDVHTETEAPIGKISQDPQYDEVFEQPSNDKKGGRGRIDKLKISGPVNSKLNRSERHTRIPVHLPDGEKKKNNFKEMDILITGPKIFFYKDAKAMQPKSNHPDGKPELVLNIQEIDYREQHFHNLSRNYLIELTKTDGYSAPFYLDMKSKSEQDCWMSALKLAKEWAQSDMFSSNNERIRYDISRTRSVRVSGFPEATVNKLNVFLKRRPTKDDLREIGIFRDETVFGNLLTNICEREGVTIPKFVTQCITAIETKGLSMNGIYRVSGNASLIQSLRCMVDQNNEYNLLNGKWGPYDLADSLKLFFRELREPLFVTSIYDELIESATSKLENSSESRISRMKRVLSKLPTVHYSTAHILFHHLYQVALCCKENQMNTHNLAIVFGLNLMWPPIKSPANQSISARANTYMASCKVVEYLLDSTPEIFSQDSMTAEVTSTSL